MCYWNLVTTFMYQLLRHCKNFDSICLPQFPTFSASLNTVESHCLLCIPTVIRFSRTLVNVMGEWFANEILRKVCKWVKEPTFSYSDIVMLLLWGKRHSYLCHQMPIIHSLLVLQLWLNPAQTFIGYSSCRVHLLLHAVGANTHMIVLCHEVIGT